MVRSTLYKAEFESPLGRMVLVSDENYLLGLWFEEQNFFGGQYDLENIKQATSAPIKTTLAWLKAYFQGINPDVRQVPIKYSGSPFSQAVLAELQNVTYGTTITYKMLSDRVQKDVDIKVNKARAVGNAVGRNPFTLLIPCHRVVGSDGSLTGYAGGIARKQALLILENPDFK